MSTAKGHRWKEVVGYHVWEECVKFFLGYQCLALPYLLPSPRDFVRLRRFSWTYAVQLARPFLSVSQIGNEVRLREARCGQVLKPKFNDIIGPVYVREFMRISVISG
jgi:hypothetical protein